MIVLLDRDFSVIEHLGSEARINKIEDLEGEKTIKVEYPLNLSDGIKVRRLFWYDKGVYRITKVKVDLDKIIAECDHVFYEIARERPKTVTYTHITARLGMEMALTGSMWQVGEVWTTALRTTDKFEDKNPLALLTEVAKAWGGELDFRVELSNSGQLSFFVDLLQRRGSFKGDRIEIGYNLEGIQYEEDTESIITALVARGNTGEMDANGNMGYFDFKDVEWSIAKGDPVNKPLGQDWIGDHEALEVYGTMDLSGTKRHIFDLYVSEAKTSQELINATWLILNRRNKPRVNIEAKVKMLPADDIKLGDTVFVITERDRVEARVVRVSEVDGEPENTTVELGNYRRNVMDRMIEVEHIAIELKRKEGVYDRASFFVPTDGGTEYILDIGEKNIRIVGDTNFYWDGSGFFTVNPNNPNEYMRNDKDGIRFTKDGGVTWGTAIDYNGMRVGKNTIFEEGYDPTQIDFESMTEEEVTVIAENYIKTANVIAQNLKVKSANIDGRLTANQITVGSTTTFATNYDPTSKETPTGAQTKATNALNSAKAYTDGAITTYDGNLKTHLETEFSVRDGEILSRVTQQELQAVDDKFSSYSTTSQVTSAINQKAGEILSSVSGTYSTKDELGTLGERVSTAEQKITPTSIVSTVRISNEYRDDLASKNKIFVATPSPPYALGDMWITGTIVRRCTIPKAFGGVYSLSDWVQINNRVFTSTPVPPYIVGDLWVQGDSDNSEVMRCNVARASGSYVVADWVKATGYGSRLSSAESSITQHAGQIALRVEKGSIISEINQSAEAIKINAEKVNIDGSNIDLSANNSIKLAVNDGISKIKVGGVNLIPDSRYIYTYQNDVGFGTATLHDTGSEPPYFQINGNKNIISVYEAKIYEYMQANCIVGKQYTISVDVYVYDWISVGFISGKGLTNVVPHRWERISYTFTHNQGVRVGGLYAEGINMMFYRNWKLEEGTVATSWSPAIGDSVSEINMTPTSIKIRADKIDLVGKVTTEHLDVRAKSLVNNFSNSNSLVGWKSQHGILGGLGPLGVYGTGLHISNSGNNLIMSDLFEVDPNATYKFSISLYCESPHGARYFGIYAYDRNGNQISSIPYSISSKTFGTPNLNNYFWSKSGVLSGPFNGWDLVHLEGYMLGHSVADSSEIPKGKNVLSHIKMLPNTRYLSLRFLNWDNGANTSGIVAHSPSVTPVDSGVLTADRIEVTDSIGIGGKGANRANLTSSKVEYFHNNTFTGDIMAKDYDGAKLMGIHGQTMVGIEARGNPLYWNTKGASLNLAHFSNAPEMATFDLRLRSTPTAPLLQMYMNSFSQFMSFGASDWAENLVVDAEYSYGTAGKATCVRPSRSGQWGLIGTPNFPWWRGHAGQWVNVSKRSGKCEIEDCSNHEGIDFIKSLEIKQYYNKRDIAMQEKDQSHIPKLEYGLIADDAPEQVVDEDRGGILLYPFISLTAKATQEVIDHVEELEVKVSILENRVSTLEEEIMAIREMLLNRG